MIDEELFKKMLMTFDHKYEAASVFYDNLPYVRDYDLCNWTPLRMVSGNIIKYYQYKLDKPVILQTDPDGYKKNILLSRSQTFGVKGCFLFRSTRHWRNSSLNQRRQPISPDLLYQLHEGCRFSQLFFDA